MESITIFKDNRVKITTKYCEMSFDSFDEYLVFVDIVHQLSLNAKEITRKIVERKRMNKKEENKESE